MTQQILEHGFVKLPRAILQSDAWREPSSKQPWSTGKALVDLIGLARYAPGSVTIRGIQVPLEAGQFAASESFLQDRWRYSRGRVRRFLSGLQTDGLIDQQKSNVCTVITVLFLAGDSGGGTANEPADEPPNETAESPKAVQQRGHNIRSNNSNKKERVKVNGVDQKQVLSGEEWDCHLASAESICRQLGSTPNRDAKEWLLKFVALVGHGLSEDDLADSVNAAIECVASPGDGRLRYLFKCVKNRHEDIGQMLRRVTVPRPITACNWQLTREPRSADLPPVAEGAIA